MQPLVVASYYSALLDSTTSTALVFVDETRRIKIAANTTVPINIRFLSGFDAATIANPAATDVWAVIKATPSPDDTQELAVCHLGSTPTPVGDYFVGTMNTRGAELLAAIAASTTARAVSVNAFLFVAYKLSGGTYISTLPAPVTLFATGFSESDSAPTT